MNLKNKLFQENQSTLATFRELLSPLADSLQSGPLLFTEAGTPGASKVQRKEAGF